VTDFRSLGEDADVDTAEFSKIIKATRDSEIASVMAGDGRRRILDTIFERMPGSFRPGRAGATNAVIHWTITGGPNGADTYELVIENGSCALSPAPERDPRLAVTAGPVDFIKLVSGNANPVTLFMTGKLKAKGDLTLAASIQNLFDIPKG
jgi:putative sterol carrier protein